LKVKWHKEKINLQKAIKLNYNNQLMNHCNLVKKISLKLNNMNFKYLKKIAVIKKLMKYKLIWIEKIH